MRPLTHRARVTVPPAALLAGVVLFGVAGAVFSTRFSPAVGVGIGALFALVTLSFVSVDFGLYVLIASMLLGPELLVGGLGQGATAGRGITLRPEDFLLTAVCLTWLARGAILKERGLLRATPLNHPILAYAAIVALATLWGIMVGRVKPLTGFFFSLKYLQYFVLYFMVAGYCRDRAHIRNLLLALLITCALASLYGLTQIPSGVRVSAPFEGQEGEPNTFGGYLVLMLALIMSLLLHLKQPKIRLLLVGLGGLVLINLAATLSRSSYLALLPMTATFLILSEKRLPIALALFFSVAVLFALLPKSVSERVNYTWSQEEEAGQIHLGRLRLDTSTSVRLQSWQEVFLEDWPKHPVLGYGVTGYRFLDAQYPRVLAETGLCGFAAFLWLLLSLLRMGAGHYRHAHDPLLRALGLGFLAGYVGLLAHAIGTNTFIIVRIMEPFWFLAGIVAVISVVETAQEPEAPRASPAYRVVTKSEYREGLVTWQRKRL